MVNSSEVSAAVATRARIVLWRAEGRQKQDVAALAGVSRPTVLAIQHQPTRIQLTHHPLIRPRSPPSISAANASRRGLTSSIRRSHN
jgi:hypothetical protein